MNALEKVAWTELSLSVAAVCLAMLLVPWLGNGALGAFGILGFIAFGMWFLRKREAQVIVDERDQQISLRATQIGITAAWMMTFMSLIVIVVWKGMREEVTMPTMVVHWLLWIQFAVCYGVKGLVGVLSYRRQRRAAQV